jgi:hypothetical protein
LEQICDPLVPQILDTSEHTVVSRRRREYMVAR